MASLLHTNTDRVPLSPSFQHRMISGLLKGDLRLISCLDILEPEHLPAAGLPTIWSEIKKFYQESGKLPSWNIIKERVYSTVDDTSERNYFYRILRKCRRILSDAEVDYILKNVQDFGSLHRLAIAYRDSLSLFERGDLHGVREHLGKALLDNFDEEKQAYYFSSVRDRIKLRRRTPRSVVRTLISPLDNVLRDKGLRKKETGVVLAPTGTGKTRCLVHMAKAAALQRQKVVYYTLQLPVEDIEEILDATFSGVPQMDLKDNESSIIRRVEKLGRVYGDNILVKYYPRYKCGPHTLESHLRRLIASSWHPDVIIVDFLNYLLPSYKTQTSDQRYFELQSVVAEWISLCQKLNLVGWGGFQANRAASDHELVSKEDVAESYGAAMEATLMISINRTPTEKSQEKARLFVCKYTHGADGIVLPIFTNYEKGSFYSRPGGL